MTNKSPKRCPKGSRKDKNGVCKKVIKGGEDDDEYDERLFALNPFNPDRKKSPKKDRSPKLKHKKTKMSDSGVIGSTISTAAAVVNSLTSAAVSAPLLALDSVAEIFKHKQVKEPPRKKSPVLARTVKKALASKKRRKPVLELEARDDSDESESVGSSDTEDSSTSSESDLSGFIDYDDDVPDDSGYRKKLNKFIARQRSGAKRH
jgi:hypothetical protein